MKLKNYEKLPIWAKNEINKLKSNIDYYKSQLAMIEGKEETNIFISHLMEEKPLPSNARIIFRLGDGKEMGDVSIRVIDDELDVSFDSRFQMTGVIMPRFSNNIRIKFIKENF